MKSALSAQNVNARQSVDKTQGYLQTLPSQRCLCGSRANRAASYAHVGLSKGGMLRCRGLCLQTALLKPSPEDCISTKVLNASLRNVRMGNTHKLPRQRLKYAMWPLLRCKEVAVDQYATEQGRLTPRLTHLEVAAAGSVQSFSHD